jgi:hypothetical protein
MVVAGRKTPCPFGYITDLAYLVQWLVYSVNYPVTYSISITWKFTPEDVRWPQRP